MNKKCKFVYDIVYLKDQKKVKHNGEMIGVWANDVIIQLLDMYPDCTGVVKFKEKLRD